MLETAEAHQSSKDRYSHRANERFLPFESDETRTAYEERGLTYTNNLKLYLTGNPKLEIMPGVPDPYDYNYQDFGCVIGAFRTEYPEIWQAVQRTLADRKRAEKVYLGKLMLQDDSASYAKEVAETCRWDFIKAMSDAYDVLAQMLAKDGFDPLDVCI